MVIRNSENISELKKALINDGVFYFLVGLSFSILSFLPDDLQLNWKYKVGIGIIIGIGTIIYILSIAFYKDYNNYLIAKSIINAQDIIVLKERWFVEFINDESARISRRLTVKNVSDSNIERIFLSVVFDIEPPNDMTDPLILDARVNNKKVSASYREKGILLKYANKFEGMGWLLLDKLNIKANNLAEIEIIYEHNVFQNSKVEDWCGSYIVYPQKKLEIVIVPPKNHKILFSKDVFRDNIKVLNCALEVDSLKEMGNLNLPEIENNELLWEVPYPRINNLYKVLFKFVEN